MAAAFALTVSLAVSGEFQFIDNAGDKRPPIWREADSQDALKAETAARIDAWSKLAEFIGGMEVKGATSVRNLVDVNAAVTGTLRARLSRMSTERVVHYPNGMIQVEVSARLSDLAESVESCLRETTVGGTVIDSKSFRSVNSADGESVVSMWGNSALRGSEGEGVVRAVRAAELAAMEQMAAKLESVQIGRETIVQDLVLASDRIKTCIDDSVKGIQYEDYRVLSDIVEVDARVRFVSIIERVERVFMDVYTTNLCGACPTVEKREFEQVVQREESVDHKVTGKAAIKDYAVSAPRRTSSVGPGGESITETTDAGGTRTVRRETVTEKVVKTGIAVN